VANWLITLGGSHEPEPSRLDFLGKEATILYHCLTDFDQDLFDTNVKQMTLTFYRIIYLQKIGG